MSVNPGGPAVAFSLDGTAVAPHDGDDRPRSGPDHSQPTRIADVAAQGVTMADSSGRTAKSVISRTGRLLEAFRPDHRELSLNQLARRAALPVSTTYRMASELVDWGAVERVDGGGYRIGLRPWEIGSLADRATSMFSVVIPFMKDLYEVTHETIQLAVLDGQDALFIEKIYGARSAPVRSTRGGRLPLHCTGVGKVLLAHAPAELLDQLLENGLDRYTPYTMTTARELNRSLSEIRRTGISLQTEEMNLGLMSVASGVHDANGVVVAALSVVFRSSRSQMRQLAPVVRTAAVSASRQLREQGLCGVSADGLLRILHCEQLPGAAADPDGTRPD
jgi:DNA-binding IclR family transcriptional regulator